MDLRAVPAVVASGGGAGRVAVNVSSSTVKGAEIAV